MALFPLCFVQKFVCPETGAALSPDQARHAESASRQPFLDQSLEQACLPGR